MVAEKNTPPIQHTALIGNQNTIMSMLRALISQGYRTLKEADRLINLSKNNKGNNNK